MDIEPESMFSLDPINHQEMSDEESVKDKDSLDDLSMDCEKEDFSNKWDRWRSHTEKNTHRSLERMRERSQNENINRQRSLRSINGMKPIHFREM